MADLTITASQVVKGSDAIVEDALAGGTITAGMSVYKDTSVTPEKWKPADADAVASAGRDGLGIALHGASDGQPLRIQKGGTEITLGAGAAPAKGTIYVVSTTAGGIAPDTDLLTGDFVSVLGVGDGTSKLKLCMAATGVDHV